MLRVLFNYHIPSQCASLELLWFGGDPGCHFAYAYQEDFGVFVQKLLDAGEQIDGVLFYLPEVSEMPPGLEHCPVPTIGMYSDWNLNFAQVWSLIGLFDCVLMDKVGTQLLKHLGVSHVREFNMYSLHLLKTAPEDTPATDLSIADVVFVGNVAPAVQKERGRWLRRLLRLRDRLNVRVETRIFGGEFRSALRNAKVVFNHSIRGEANMRVFETLLVGGVVFLEQNNAEIRDFLTPGEECCLYDDAQMESELLALVNDTERCAKMRIQAQLHEPNWSAQGRWSVLANILSEVRVRAERKSLGTNSEELLAVNLECYWRGSLIEGLVRQVDALVSPSMNLRQIWLVLGRFHLHGVVNDYVVSVALALFDAARDQPSRRVWNHLHCALILGRAGSVHIAREMDIWQSLLDVLAGVSAEELEGFPLYALPFGRHADLQAALWNHRAPRTFPDSPTLIPYLQHWALQRLGEIAYMSGALPQALGFLQDSLRLYPRDAETWQRLAEFTDVNDPIHLTALENCFEIDPMQPEIGVKLLEARLRAMDFVGASALCWELEGLMSLQCKVYQGLALRQAEFMERVNVVRIELRTNI